MGAALDRLYGDRRAKAFAQALKETNDKMLQAGSVRPVGGDEQPLPRLGAFKLRRVQFGENKGSPRMKVRQIQEKFTQIVAAGFPEATATIRGGMQHPMFAKIFQVLFRRERQNFAGRPDEFVVGFVGVAFVAYEIIHLDAGLEFDALPSGFAMVIRHHVLDCFVHHSIHRSRFPFQVRSFPAPPGAR